MGKITTFGALTLGSIFKPAYVDDASRALATKEGDPRVTGVFRKRNNKPSVNPIAMLLMGAYNTETKKLTPMGDRMMNTEWVEGSHEGDSLIGMGTSTPLDEEVEVIEEGDGADRSPPEPVLKAFSALPVGATFKLPDFSDVNIYKKLNNNPHVPAQVAIGTGLFTEEFKTVDGKRFPTITEKGRAAANTRMIVTNENLPDDAMWSSLESDRLVEPYEVA
jgi:hypothetical protein